ncbi:Protein of unknown function [Evansella caseinilytica]|uniref:DUF3866 family protein n=1 Tax=Evansella caseinilytica TaxID=1503961 RepID=A0A1H3L4W5_9BACI|nr:DUF3866 family protein [Evansella caseinilytica]SDY59463.1 Protein of unknown function [Evansella caseinilytica]
MISEDRVQVLKILEKTEEMLRLKINGGSGKAILYRRLQPDVIKGDWVVINKTATDLKLGTGGWDIVRAVVDARPICNLRSEKLGHIMKARYLGDQHSVLALEAPESEEHELFQNKCHLNGRWILLGELHSMLPVIWFLLQLTNRCRLSAIISDEASLPLVMSNHLHYLHQQPRFYSITTGQAFGGNGETVNTTTALQYISERFTDGMIVMTLGPGAVGTGTRYGFSGLVQANWANQIGSLGGVPVWIPRLSAADPRERQRGISHHTLTPLTELTLVDSILPLPAGNYSTPRLEEDIDYLTAYKQVNIRKVDEDRLLPYLNEVQKQSPFPLTSMGRTLDADPLFFLGIAAACSLFMEEAEHQSINDG